MAWELVYTSAPQGLAEGSRGFCTVAATRGFPSSLLPRVEALSGYRPVPTSERDGRGQPVQHTHVRLEHAGQSLSVISRIVFAGQDYSGRTNKLAHHVVLLPEEQAALPEGPAAWADRFEGWRDRWEGEPQVFEPLEVGAVSTSRRDARCTTWAEAAGDAGWAGVLAESFLLDPSRPFHVRHDPQRHDALALIDEAMWLLPEPARWRTTYATYYTDPLPESGVAWRFAVAGASVSEAKFAGGASHAIDLLNVQGKPEPSRYVCLARGEPVDGPEAPERQAVASEVRTEPKGVSPAVSVPTAPAVPRSAMPDSRPPDPHRAVASANVPARWFWAAAIGWPVLLGLGIVIFGGFGVSEGSSNDSDIVTPTPTAEQVHQEPTDSQDRIMALEAELAEANRRFDALMRALAASEAGAVDFAAATRHEENTSTASVTIKPAVLDPDQFRADDLDAASPPTGLEDESAASLSAIRDSLGFVAAELPRPSLRSSGAVGVGALAALAGSETVLWRDLLGRAGRIPGVSVELRPARLPISEALGIAWKPTDGGAELRWSRADALGGTRSVVIGHGRWEPQRSALVWRWTNASLDRTTADALREIGAEAAGSVWELTDADGVPIARVQGVILGSPTRCLIGGAANLGASDASLVDAVEFSGLRLIVEALPSGWSAYAESDRPAMALEHASGATLTVSLKQPGSQVHWKADWFTPVESLLAELSEREEALEQDRLWWSAWSSLRDERREVENALPKTPDGQIDETRRGSPSASAAFGRWDTLTDEIAEVRNRRPGIDPVSVQASIETAETALTELRNALQAMNSFPGVRVSAVLRTSGARLFETEVMR